MGGWVNRCKVLYNLTSKASEWLTVVPETIFKSPEKVDRSLQICHGPNMTPFIHITSFMKNEEKYGFV